VMIRACLAVGSGLAPSGLRSDDSKAPIRRPARSRRRRPGTRIETAPARAIQRAIVTNAPARHLPGATELKTARFAGPIVGNM
jgi:hypothetical protein